MKIIGAFFLTVSIASLIVLRFQHPDATDTRLFIDHWFKIIPLLLMGLVGGWLVYGRDK